MSNCVCEECGVEFCSHCGQPLPCEEGPIEDSGFDEWDCMPTVADYYWNMASGHKYESPWLKFGELSLPSGQLGIGDQMKVPESCPIIELPPDDYLLAIKAVDSRSYQATTRLRVAREPGGVLGDIIAEVSVLGWLGVCDLGIGGAVMPVVKAGFGDNWVYQVRELLKDEARIGIEVEFFEPCDE